MGPQRINFNSLFNSIANRVQSPQSKRNGVLKQLSVNHNVLSTPTRNTSTAHKISNSLASKSPVRTKSPIGYRGSLSRSRKANGDNDWSSQFRNSSNYKQSRSQMSNFYSPNPRRRHKTPMSTLRATAPSFDPLFNSNDLNDNDEIETSSPLLRRPKLPPPHSSNRVHQGWVTPIRKPVRRNPKNEKRAPLTHPTCDFSPARPLEAYCWGDDPTPISTPLGTPQRNNKRSPLKYQAPPGLESHHGSVLKREVSMVNHPQRKLFWNIDKPNNNKKKKKIPPPPGLTGNNIFRRPHPRTNISNSLASYKRTVTPPPGLPLLHHDHRYFNSVIKPISHSSAKSAIKSGVKSLIAKPFPSQLSMPLQPLSPVSSSQPELSSIRKSRHLLLSQRRKSGQQSFQTSRLSSQSQKTESPQSTQSTQSPESLQSTQSTQSPQSIQSSVSFPPSSPQSSPSQSTSSPSQSTSSSSQSSQSKIQSKTLQSKIIKPQIIQSRALQTKTAQAIISQPVTSVKIPLNRTNYELQSAGKPEKVRKVGKEKKKNQKKKKKKNKGRRKKKKKKKKKKS